MTEDQFSELRTYAEAEGSCIDMGYRPGAGLISKAWLTEVVPGCWAITEKGRKAFEAVVEGRADLTPGRRS